MVAKANVDGMALVPERLKELESTCFVIMPFGQKPVGKVQVDFDVVYQRLFKPAIKGVRTPERSKLVVHRTDKDLFSGSIDQDMFEYIMYSRLAFVDISGLNANVFYELGARHASQESGTILFRQKGQAIPFDIKSIKVFEYDHQSANSSQKLIRKVVKETLQRNRLDSPVRIALRAQWGGPPPSKKKRTKNKTQTEYISGETPGRTCPTRRGSGRK